MDHRAFAVAFIDHILSQKHAWKMEGTSNLPQGAYGVLTFLHYQHDGASVGELTEYLQVTSGRTATLLKRLEKKGLIRREQAATDKRVFYAYITEAGRHQVNEEYEQMVTIFSQRFEKLGDKDAEAYVRIMKKLYD